MPAHVDHVQAVDNKEVFKVHSIHHKIQYMHFLGLDMTSKILFWKSQPNYHDLSADR
jgi:hypothetical protein